MKKFLLPCIFMASAAFIPVGHPMTAAGPDHPAFSHSHNQFAFHFMKAALDEDSSNSNKLISPLSLYVALSVLYNGADHATRDSIGEMLQATSIGALNLGGLCKKILMQLPAEDQQVHLSLVNSIWANNRKTLLKPAFANLTEELYYTPIRPLVFGSRSALSAINSWVDANSFHRIPRLLSKTNPRDFMYLVNVLYFKSAWNIPFDLSHTRKSVFYLPDGNTITNTPFMNRTGNTQAFSDTGFTMVELPFGSGKSYSMYLIMPEDTRRPLRDFAAAFTPDRLDYACTHMTTQSIDLYLPRWQYTYSMDNCAQALSDMGMGIAFDNRTADFSNMYKPQPNNEGGGCLSDVIHQSVISVDEKGTESAAEANVIAPVGPDLPRRQPRAIKADHPFMYMIVEKQRNIVLFMGLVNDPDPAAKRLMLPAS